MLFYFLAYSTVLRKKGPFCFFCIDPKKKLINTNTNSKGLSYRNTVRMRVQASLSHAFTEYAVLLVFRYSNLAEISDDNVNLLIILC